MTASANDNAKSERSRLFLYAQLDRRSLCLSKIADNARMYHFSPVSINLPQVAFVACASLINSALQNYYKNMPAN
ncbi:MAG: hypothetical protein HRU78_13455 [Gammaproteobacteria bacterium]|nr:MAG: hypothetical protein HRU78_13455 [Gammaproteobacteria bacterium]